MHFIEVFKGIRNRPHLVLDPVVVDGKPAVVDEVRERLSALEAVVQSSGDGTAVGHLSALRPHPTVQRVSNAP